MEKQESAGSKKGFRGHSGHETPFAYFFTFGLFLIFLKIVSPFSRKSNPMAQSSSA
jgi:hypothetical protein